MKITHQPAYRRVELTLRVPAEIHGQLLEYAAQNDRSLNAEIIQRLRASLESYRKF